MIRDHCVNQSLNSQSTQAESLGQSVGARGHSRWLQGWGCLQEAQSSYLKKEILKRKNKLGLAYNIRHPGIVAFAHSSIKVQHNIQANEKITVLCDLLNTYSMSGVSFIVVISKCLFLFIFPLFEK